MWPGSPRPLTGLLERHLEALAGGMGIGAAAAAGYGWMAPAGLLLAGAGAALIGIAASRRRFAADAARSNGIINSSPLGLAIMDPDGTIRQISDSYCDLIGYRPVELIGRPFADITYHEDKHIGFPEVGAALDGKTTSYSFAKRLIRADGSIIWVQVFGRLHRDPKTGEPLALLSQVEDITHRRQVEDKLRSDESRWSFALESAGQGVWDADLVTGACYYSRTWKAMLGYGEHELEPNWDTWTKLLHPDDMEAAVAAGEAHIAGETSLAQAKFRMRHKDGRWVWMLDRGKVLARDANGRALRMIGVQTDITDYVAVSDALALEKERLRITLGALAEAVISTDIDGRVLFMNAAAEELTGRSAAFATGRSIEEVYAPVDEATSKRRPSIALAAIAAARTIQADQPAILSRPDGAERAVHDIASPVIDARGQQLGAVLIVQDVTAARANQRELAYAATHDALTGLANRAFFDRALTERLAKAAGEGGALLYIDLDRFKFVNDVSGHSAGDALLREVAAVILDAVPASSIVARLGGDEFAVLLAAGHDCEAVADKVLTGIGSVRFVWKGTVHDVGGSIGMAPLDAAGATAETVLAQADVACYAAKAAGRNRVSVYRPEAGEAQRHMAELRVASGIKAAIEDNRLVLYGQEIRRLTTPLSRGQKIEILVRMIGQDGSVLPPGAFIPSAERFQLMGAIDRWVLHQTIVVNGPAIMLVPDLRVGVNLSADSLSDPNLTTFLKSELEAGALRPDRLTFEITETAMINNFTAAERFVTEAIAMGCRVNLDDFGSGVSSFSYLKRFRVHAIKIDGCFVRNVAHNEYDRTVVRLIRQLADEIGAETIAEYVEDADALAALQEIGVDFGQGYFFHRPRPLGEVLAERRPTLPPPALQQRRQAS